MSRQLSTLALLFALLVSTDKPASGQEWTRFRGPNGTGVSAATNIPVEWGADDYRWKISLPGKGHGSPVVWGNRLFVNAERNDGGTRVVICVDTRDGRTLWSRDFEASNHKKHKVNSFASSTPVVDDKHVYVSWAVPKKLTLLALDHEGNEVWNADLGPFKGGHGFAGSPIVYGETIILANDQNGKSSLIAVDRNTGRVLWNVPRHSKRITYSTPCVYSPKGREPVLIFTNWQHGITAINPTNGKTVWEKSVFLLSRSERAIGSPVIAGDLVIGTCGFVTAEKHVVAVRPGKSGKPDDVEEVWRIERGVPHIPTALVHKDRVYLWSDKGIVTCANAQTGKTVWMKRVGGNYLGSPICVNDRLYAINDAGEVVVIAAADEYKLLARNPLGERSQSTPAIAGGMMFLRSLSHLYAVGGGTEEAK
jgi:outer membrane protein assembly factor BamB